MTQQQFRSSHDFAMSHRYVTSLCFKCANCPLGKAIRGWVVGNCLYMLDLIGFTKSVISLLATYGSLFVTSISGSPRLENVSSNFSIVTAIVQACVMCTLIHLEWVGVNQQQKHLP